MKGIPRGRYTKEFRQEAVKLVIEEKLSWGKAVRRLSLAPTTIGSWVNAYQEGKLGEIGKAYRPLTEVEMELARVKKENTTLKIENEILKKLPHTLPGSRCPVCGHERNAAQLSSSTSESYAWGIHKTPGVFARTGTIGRPATLLRPGHRGNGQSDARLIL
jgi:transposase